VKSGQYFIELIHFILQYMHETLQELNSTQVARPFLSVHSQGTCDYQGVCSDEENWALYMMMTLPHPGEKPHLFGRLAVSVMNKAESWI